MSINATRQTLYALLSAIEEDLRNEISKCLGPTPISILFSNDEEKKIRDRYKADIGIMPSQNISMGESLIYLDFGDTFKVINSNKAKCSESIVKQLNEKSAFFDKSVQIRNRIAHSRPVEFDDLPFILDFSNELINGNFSSWTNTTQCLSKLESNPDFVFKLTIPTNDEKTRVINNLPFPETDETGFIGRSKQVSDLISLLQGSYPVISIIGDGGMGKTALALKVAYEIIDRDKCNFDYVIWISSKTAKLTLTDIVKIDSAISDSIGVISEIEKNMGIEYSPAKTEDRLNAIREYLSQFKILLILDNLETVLDQNIRTLLAGIPSGSKILITSRIGVGSFEYPYKLTKLEIGDCLKLLRALLRSKGLTSYQKIDEAILKKYIERLEQNPAFIKWFAASLHVGYPPESIFSKQDIFLKYCMDNVYKYLSEKATAVLRVLQVIQGKISLPEIIYISQMDHDHVNTAILELLNTNMVSMISVSTGAAIEVRYELADLASSYLNQCKPVRGTDFSNINKRKLSLAYAAQESENEKTKKPYSFNAVRANTVGERVVAKFLIDALNKMRKGDYPKSIQLINEAKDISPEYSEVHRIEGLFHFNTENPIMARLCYERAIELDDQSPYVRYHFAGLLLREFHDVIGALEQLIYAQKLDPHASEIQLEIGRCKMFEGKWEESDKILTSVSPAIESDTWFRKKWYDTKLSLYLRAITSFVSNHDYSNAILTSEKFNNTCLLISEQDKDERIIQKIHVMVANLSDLRSRINKGQEETWTTSYKKICSIANIQPRTDLTNFDKLEIGTIIRFREDRNFGFIKWNEEELFFHCSDIKNLKPGNPITIGTEVRFSVGINPQGQCAKTIMIIE